MDRPMLHRVMLHRFMLPMALALAGAAAAWPHGAARAQAQAMYPVVEGLFIQVPRHKPTGDTWDSALGGLSVGRIRGIYPDIRICLSSEHIPQTCLPDCPVDQLECKVARINVLAVRDLQVEVLDIDARTHDTIANVVVPDPSKCTPCEFDVSGETLRLHFTVARRASYTGPWRGSIGEIAAALPSAERPAEPTQSLRTLIDAAMAGLRDARNCVGKDLHFAQGTVRKRAELRAQGFSEEALDRAYRLASLASSIDEPEVRQRVLEGIRADLGENPRTSQLDYDNLFMAVIMPDAAHSQDLVAAFKEVAGDFGGRLVRKRLERVIPMPVMSPDYTLAGAVDQFIFRRLTTRPLVRQALRLFDQPEVTTECALNELARAGLEESAGLR